MANPTPAVPPAAKKPPIIVGPIITVAKNVVLVKRDYTSPKRRAVVLKADKAVFDGTGSLNRSSDAIIFFDAETGGNRLGFDGSGNFSLTAAELAAGKTIFAQGKDPGEVTLTLTLNKGSQNVNPPKSAKITSVRVTLDICDAAKNPLAAKKNDPGRTVNEQNKVKKHSRAKLVVAPIEPAGFKGTLVLKVSNGKTSIFDREKHAAGETSPTQFASDKIPAELWTEGVKASDALKDTKISIGLQGIDDDADHVTLTVAKLDLIKVDDHFAPNNEKLDIQFEIKHHLADKLQLEVSSGQYDKNPILQRDLTAAEKADGTKTINWDGKSTCADGSLKGGLFIHPLLAPYKVRITDGLDSTDELEFKVLYHSLNLKKGPLTPDETEPDKTAAEKDWVQFKLNDLGYWGGPVGKDFDSYLDKAITRYRANHKNLHKLNGYGSGADKYSTAIDAPLKTALGSNDNKRTVLSDEGVFSDSSKVCNVVVEELFFEQDESLNDTKVLREAARLNRPLIPVEVEILVKKKDDSAVFSAEAVGPARVNWKFIDPDEDLSKQLTKTAKEPSFGKAYIEKCLKLKDGRKSTNGDNCHKDFSGIREAPADNYKTPFVLGDIYIPYTVEDKASQKVVFTKASVDRTAKNLKRLGKAGVFFRPSFIAGDDYQLKAEIDFTDDPNHANLEKFHKVKPGDPKTRIHKDSGTFRIRRSQKVAMVINWPARTNAPEWDKIHQEYERAYLDLDTSTFATKNITDVITQADWTDVVHNNAKLAALPQPANPNYATAAVTLDPTTIYPVPLPAQGNMAAGVYRTLISGLAYRFFDNVDQKDANGKDLQHLISKKVRPTQPAGLIVITVLSHQAVNILADPFHGNMTIVNANFVASTFSEAVCDGIVYIDMKDGDQVYYVVGHEMGHTMWLRHWETVGAGTFPTDHDQNDHNCIMSYTDAPARPVTVYTPHLCGKCNLRIRGWDITAAGMPAKH